ncbi:MAG: nitroreductase family protein [Methanobacteriota archaeon]|nr:MAG: nitroreductase family protein [Euryarchaeota archaeon]
MEVIEAIGRRRALRALDSRHVEDSHASSLVEAATLSASCFNNQPWRMILCTGEECLDSVKAALPKGNAWATRSPLIIIVAAKPDEDCQLSDRRDYYSFDCGLAVGQMLLRATELGFVAHPIAGYDPAKVRSATGIPEDHIIVTLVICGHRDSDDSLLSDKQKEVEAARPERKPVGDNFFRDSWGSPWE